MEDKIKWYTTYMKDCIFCKIVNGEIPKEFAYEDDSVVAFEDINPQAKVHLLVIPKEHIADFFDSKNSKTHMSIVKALHHLIEKNNLMGKGYKVEINGGGAQIVPHLHFHLLGPVGTYK